MYTPTRTPHAGSGDRSTRSSRLPVALSIAAASAIAVGSVSAPTFAARGDDEVLIAAVATISPAVVTLRVATDAAPTSTEGGFGGPGSQGSGSGVIIDASGLILTNAHVAADATDVTVILQDGRTFEGETIGVDTLTDFAFVRIEGTDLPTATLGASSDIRIGQLAIAVGNPLGDFPGSVTTGIISGVDRTIQVADQQTGGATTLRHLIQTDAAINPGNSGGVLVDGAGQVIGINTAASGDAMGIGFALPIDLAKPIIEQVLAGEPIERPWIGIRYEEIDAQVAEDNDLTVTEGAWIDAGDQDGVKAVLANSPAKDAGLKDGDIITAIGDQAVDREHPLDLLLLQHSPGDTVALTVLRDDASISVDLTLGTRPASTD